MTAVPEMWSLEGNATVQLDPFYMLEMELKTQSLRFQASCWQGVLV